MAQLAPPLSPVVVPPRETLSHVLQRGEALHELDDLQVGHIQLLRVTGDVEVLGGLQHSLCGRVRQDRSVGWSEAFREGQKG